MTFCILRSTIFLCYHLYSLQKKKKKLKILTQMDANQNLIVCSKQHIRYYLYITQRFFPVNFVLLTYKSLN